MRQQEQEIYTLIEPAVTLLGYELLGVRYSTSGKRATLRVYIDSEHGITVADCERVSYQVSGLLDVHDPVPGRYTLEISSPGLDRPLFFPGHFERFKGHRVSIKLGLPLDGRRKFSGELRGCHDGKVVVWSDDTEYVLPLDMINSARLLPQD